MQKQTWSSSRLNNPYKSIANINIFWQITNLPNLNDHDILGGTPLNDNKKKHRIHHPPPGACWCLSDLKGQQQHPGEEMKSTTTSEIPSLKLTAKAPRNGWLEYDPFLLGFGLFSGANC